MIDYNKLLRKYGIRIPEIMLPIDKSAMESWAVIACDQYTSQIDYWKKVEELTSEKTSTLKLIFPECYLEEPEPEKRISAINKTMSDYINNSVLSDPKEGFILVKRDTPNIKNRWGLMAALDLEKYDFSVKSRSLVRATEGTILERIPPRVKIRENALLELPHIMVLIDDPEKTLIEPLTENIKNFEKVYDFDLMMDSGHLSGYRIDSPEYITQIARAFEKLGSAEVLKSKYNSEKGFLFAMGDGNHSLATAKTIWETYKANNPDKPGLMEHPSRWALVELVNIFSDGIEFEAIHRIIFDVNQEKFFKELADNPDFKVLNKNSLEEVIKTVDSPEGRQICGFSHSKGFGIIEALNPDSSIIAGTIQNYLDEYLKNHTDTSIDYIHGIDVTAELGRRDGNIGFFLPAIAKETFFQTVVDDGAFPRKTFSMGEAFEKRFYVETRKIK